MLPTERFTYSPIFGRPRLRLPGSARLAVWVIVNVEEWKPARATAAYGVATTGRGGRRCRTCPTGRGTNTETALSRSGVLFWTGEKILDWYRATQNGTRSNNSRATIAVCDNTLPVSATIAPARRNTIIQAADVVGHTNTSPAARSSALGTSVSTTALNAGSSAQRRVSGPNRA
jgi:hypothetical protein